MFLMFIDSAHRASQIVRGKHLAVMKFSLNRSMLKATYSSLKGTFQRLTLPRGNSVVTN